MMTEKTGKCLECQHDKIIYLKGTCRTCYERRGRNNRNNLGTCAFCKRRRVLNNDSLCHSCKTGQTKLVVCLTCGNTSPHFSKGLCSRCYKKQWHRSQRKVECACCDEVRATHAHDSEGKSLCMSCYASTRKGICCQCGSLARIAKRCQDGMLCWRCYQKIRPAFQCDTCGVDGILSVANPPMCHTCYARKYNQEPETVARKAVFLAKRRSVEVEGNFSKQDWLDMMRMWDWKCAYCDDKLKRGTRSTDHVVPISKGGENERNNIVPCCRNCNSRKNNHLLCEWLDCETCERIMLRIANMIGG
jgi:hypothetical protein